MVPEVEYIAIGVPEMSPDTIKPQQANERDVSPRRTGVLVRDLPVPPDLAREIEAVCKTQGTKSGPARDWTSEGITLWYHYR